jgi:hypothetical protein
MHFTCLCINKKILKLKMGADHLNFIYAFFLVGWDLRHQVLRPLLAYCTAPDDR